MDMSRKALILYASVTGNTAKIAQCFDDALTEMGWSVDYSQIAPELLQAKLVTLNMWWSPLRGTAITADILLPRIQVEAANAFYGKEV